jgi:hypothetical protein
MSKLCFYGVFNFKVAGGIFLKIYWIQIKAAFMGAKIWGREKMHLNIKESVGVLDFNMRQIRSTRYCANQFVGKRAEDEKKRKKVNALWENWKSCVEDHKYLDHWWVELAFFFEIWTQSFKKVFLSFLWKFVFPKSQPRFTKRPLD